MSIDLPAASAAPSLQGKRTRGVFGMVAYSLALVCLTGWVTHWIDKKSEFFNRGSQPKVESGPWGDLLISDIRVEQPREYAGFGPLDSNSTVWRFGKLTPPELQQYLKESGLSQAQTEEALAPENVTTAEGTTEIRPKESLILSLSPEVRSKFYLRLAANPANRTYATPYFVPDGDVSRLFKGDKESSPKIEELVKRLLYKRNGFDFFSDGDLVLSHISTPEGRLDFYRSLTGQNAVIARVLIRRAPILINSSTIGRFPCRE